MPSSMSWSRDSTTPSVTRTMTQPGSSATCSAVRRRPGSTPSGAPDPRSITVGGPVGPDAAPAARDRRCDSSSVPASGSTRTAAAVTNWSGASRAISSSAASSSAAGAGSTVEQAADAGAHVDHRGRRADAAAHHVADHERPARRSRCRRRRTSRRRRARGRRRPGRSTPRSRTAPASGSGLAARLNWSSSEIAVVWRKSSARSSAIARCEARVSSSCSSSCVSGLVGADDRAHPLETGRRAPPRPGRASAPGRSPR